VITPATVPTVAVPAGSVTRLLTVVVAPVIGFVTVMPTVEVADGTGGGGGGSVCAHEIIGMHKRSRATTNQLENNP